MFAGDTNIYNESSSSDKLERTVNRELNKLFLWLNVNQLLLNIDNTNFIVFHPYNKPIKKRITIKINNKAIKGKEYIKYLGVLIGQVKNVDIGDDWDNRDGPHRPHCPLCPRFQLACILLVSQKRGHWGQWGR